MKPARNIIELCKSLIYRHSLERVGEVVLAVFFIGECNFDSMGVDLSGRNGQAKDDQCLPSLQSPGQHRGD